MRRAIKKVLRRFRDPESSGSRGMDSIQPNQGVNSVQLPQETYSAQPNHTMDSIDDLDRADRSPIGDLAYLPNDIIWLITTFLSNRDRKSLRLVSKFYKDITMLRLDRVFLSSHPRDLQVLQAVATHGKFHHQVKELVYDVGKLRPYPPYDSVWAPSWYRDACKATLENIGDIRHRFLRPPFDVEIEKRIKTRLWEGQSWRIYQKLARQQQEALARGEDAGALIYALKRFPNLRRIIMTKTAHGICFMPRYETPLIRSLPRAFLYPDPSRQLDSSETWYMRFVAPGWETQEEQRELRVVVDALTITPHHNVTEFVIDNSQLLAGLACGISMDSNLTSNSSTALENFITRVSETNSTRMDLTLYVASQENQECLYLRDSCLKTALENASDLQHFSLTAGLPCDPEAAHLDLYDFYSSGTRAQHVPLKKLLPVECWENLLHFRLSYFPVKQDDLLELLAALPTTLRSVDLRFLTFLERGSYRNLLGAMRSTLRWKDKPYYEQPEIIVKVERRGVPTDVSKEVNHFMYRDGKNPFEDGTV